MTQHTRIHSLHLNFRINGTEIVLPFRAVCSVTKKPFRGNIIVSYVPRKRTLEYVDAELQIRKLTKNELTAEELCHKVWVIVWRSIHPISLRVLIDVRHSTAHQPVKVWINSPGSKFLSKTV